MRVVVVYYTGLLDQDLKSTGSQLTGHLPPLKISYMSPKHPDSRDADAVGA